MIQSLKTFSTVFFLFLLILVVAAGCQEKAEVEPVQNPGTVRGKVTMPQDQLLAGAVVKITGIGFSNSSVTTEAGTYSFNSLKPGAYSISVTRAGYTDASATVQIKSDEVTTHDFQLTAGSAYLRILTDTVFAFGVPGGTFPIEIESNTSWVLINTSDWITSTKQGSAGDDKLVATINTTTLDTLRQYTLALQAGNITKRIVVKQFPVVRLKNVIVIPGNIVTKVADSVKLVFNQPIASRSVAAGFKGCVSDIRFKVSGDTVTFSYGCAVLGGEYPFTITALNRFGDQLIENITAAFHDKIIKFTGHVLDYFVNDQDNTYWVLAKNPGALYKVDIKTFDILHRYELPGMPAMFTVNPYNNKIYLAYENIPKLFVMGQNGVVEKEIDIPHDKTRTWYESNGPRINPVKLVFGKNGKGLIWLGAHVAYSSTGVWFIDAAADHRIWYDKSQGEELSYVDAKANFNKTKLLLTNFNDEPTFDIFDTENMSFSRIRPNQTTRGAFISPSRKTGTIFSGQLNSQLLINPSTGYESKAMTPNNRSFGYADFSYRAGKEQTVYFSHPGYIEVLDFQTHTTPIKYDAIYFMGITNTLDGKYIIGFNHDGNYNAKIVRLPGKWFD